MSHRSLMNGKVQLAFATAILTLLLVGIVSWRSLAASTESEHWVQHTHEVLENLQAMLFDIQTLEANARGYALLGPGSHIEEFDANMAVFEQHKAAVHSLTQDNPRQQRELPALDRLMAEKIAMMRGIIALRRDKGPEPALAALRDATRPRLMREIKATVFQMEQEERHLLAERNAEEERQQSMARAVLLFGSLLSLTIASLAAWSVQRQSLRRSLAESALRRSEGKFRGLLEAAPDALVVLTEVGEIVLLNMEAEGQFGYSRSQLIGMPITTILPTGLDILLEGHSATSADPVSGSSSCVAVDLATGMPAPPLPGALAGTPPISRPSFLPQPGKVLELTGRRRDGSEFPVELLLSPLESSEGLLFTASIRNITERKAAEEALARVTAELRRSNTELQQFAYVASHDLQEPLRAVASYTQLIARRYKGHLDREADEFIAYAVDGCQRMKALIQDLLAYSRAGGSDAAVRYIGAGEALREALSSLRLVIEEAEARVTHDPLDALDGLGRFDSRLTRVFQNLISNAIKYRGKEPPRIHVSARPGVGQERLFTVSDNGIGIDSQYFQKIFFLFQRLHSAQEFKGTGIGLAICEKVLHHMGGRIWVDSEVGKGSSFHFALPARNETASFRMETTDARRPETLLAIPDTARPVAAAIEAAP